MWWLPGPVVPTDPVPYQELVRVALVLPPNSVLNFSVIYCTTFCKCALNVGASINPVTRWAVNSCPAPLKNRIVGRKTETEEAINLRMNNAFKELDFVTDYDYFVVNDTVHEAVQNIKSIIDAEKHRVKRFKYIKEKVLGE